MDKLLEVLVVEDDPVTADFYALHMQRWQLPVRVRVATRLEDAMRMVRDLPPALILLDVRLPDGDGTHLLRSLHATAPGCAVLVVTNLPPSAVFSRGPLLPGVSLKSKPLSMQWLNGYVCALVQMQGLAEQEPGYTALRA